jgi:hypothetical protein
VLRDAAKVPEDKEQAKSPRSGTASADRRRVEVRGPAEIAVIAIRSQGLRKVSTDLPAIRREGLDRAPQRKRPRFANGTKAPKAVFTGEGSVFRSREAFRCLPSFSISSVCG